MTDVALLTVLIVVSMLYIASAFVYMFTSFALADMKAEKFIEDYYAAHPNEPRLMPK